MIALKILLTLSALLLLLVELVKLRHRFGGGR